MMEAVMLDSSWPLRTYFQLILLAFAILPLSYYVYLKYFFKYFDPLRDIPGPEPAHWFLGNLWEIIKEGNGIPQERWRRDYGKDGMFKVRAPGPSRLYITDLHLMQQVLVKESYEYPKPKAVRDSLKAILGEGVLVAEGDVHRKQRRALNPAFAVPRLINIVPLFFGPAYKLRDHWLQLIEDAEHSGSHLTDGNMAPEINSLSNAPGQDIQNIIDVQKGLNRCTLDIIGLAGFDSDFDTVEHPESPIAQAYLDLTTPRRDALGFITAFLVRRFLPFLTPLLSFMPLGKQLSENKKIINSFTQGILSEKREKAAQEKMSGVVEDGSPKDLLSILVGMENSQDDVLSDAEINDECMTFLAAGHETTSSAMTWCLMRLSQHQDVQDRLREEVLQILSPGTKEQLSYDDLTGSQTSFLEAVCKESLRLDCPVPFTQREAKENTTLGGHYIPKGTPIVICKSYQRVELMAYFYTAPLLINRHPDYYGPTALDFDPRRWLKSEERSQSGITAAGRSPYAFLTFLAGPRNCIGQKFAMLEMKTLLAILIANFKFYEHEPGKHIERTQQITLRPKQGYLNLRIQRVEV